MTLNECAGVSIKLRATDAGGTGNAVLAYSLTKASVRGGKEKGHMSIVAYGRNVRVCSTYASRVSLFLSLSLPPFLSLHLSISFRMDGSLFGGIRTGKTVHDHFTTLANDPLCTRCIPPC